MRFVLVLETNKCLSKLIQTHNASSSILPAINLRSSWVEGILALKTSKKIKKKKIKKPQVARVIEEQICCENVYSLRIDVDVKRNEFSRECIEDSRKWKGLTLSKLDNSFPYFVAVFDRTARNQASKKFVPCASDIFPN